MLFTKRAKGYGMCFIGIMLLTPDTLFIRLLQHLPNVTVLFLRCIIPAISTTILMLCIDAKLFISTFKGIGIIGAIAGVLFGATHMLFTFAVQRTAVANVVVINSSSSIFSSISAYFIYGETIPLRTFVVILVCLGAILLVFSTSFQGDDGSLVGGILTIASAISVGVYFTLCRYKSVLCGSSNTNVDTKTDEIMDVLGYNVFGFLLASIICLCIGVEFHLVTGYDIGLLIIDGVFVLSFSFLLLTIGPLYIISAEVSLFFLIETILGPVWVYAAGYEAPPPFTVYGGICIILALASNSILALREELPLLDIITDIDTNVDADISPANNIELSPYRMVSDDEV